MKINCNSVIQFSSFVKINIIMFFKKDIELKSNFNKEEIRNKLQLITKMWGSKQTLEHQFKGKINEKEFIIYPIFNFESREQLRPEIQGRIISDNSSSLIGLKFRLPQQIKFLFGIAFLLNFGLISVMLFFPHLTDFPLWDKWWIILCVFLITYFIFLFYFNYKVSKSIKILKNVFED